MTTLAGLCGQCGLPAPCPAWCPRRLEPIGDWTRDAACADAAEPEMFFDGHDAEAIAGAKLVCSGCEAQSECLEYALRNDMRAGVWGGTTAAERRLLATLRRRRRHERELGERD